MLAKLVDMGVFNQRDCDKRLGDDIPDNVYDIQSEYVGVYEPPQPVDRHDRLCNLIPLGHTFVSRMACFELETDIGFEVQLDGFPSDIYVWMLDWNEYLNDMFHREFDGRVVTQYSKYKYGDKVVDIPDEGIQFAPSPIDHHGKYRYRVLMIMGPDVDLSEKSTVADALRLIYEHEEEITHWANWLREHDDESA